jgi:hypothetical protein
MRAGASAFKGRATLREQVINPKVAEFGGRNIETTG